MKNAGEVSLASSLSSTDHLLASAGGVTKRATKGEVRDWIAYDGNLVTEPFVKYFNTVADAQADTTLVYSSPGVGQVEVAVGDIVEAGGFRYEVAASGATDHHLATSHASTPVKMYVLPSSGARYPMAAFGITEDGTTDAASAITAAISAIRQGADIANRVTLVASGPLMVKSAVKVYWNVMIDLGGQRVMTDGNNTIFTVHKNGAVWNGRFDLDGATYSGVACILDPAGTAIQGQHTDIAWLHNCRFDLPASSGSAYKLDASVDYIQQVHTGDIVISRGADAVILDGSGAYCNGNTFGSHVFFDPDTSIQFNTASGNAFPNVVIERNSGNCEIEFIASRGNSVNGALWDDVLITEDADSKGNVVGNGSSSYPVVSSSANQSTFIFKRGEQIGNVSRVQDWDYRMGWERAFGRVEFVDDFLGGPDPKWTQNIASGGSINAKGDFEGAASPNSYIRRCQLFTAGSGTVELTFGDQDCFVTEMNPILHLVFCPVSSATGVTRIGLMQFNTGVNGVYFETDEATYADDNLRLVVDNGGTQTVTDTGVSANTVNNLFFATVEITSTNVRALLGKYNIAAGDDNGRVGRGVDALYTTTRSTYVGEWNVTTNIPVSNDMQPICTAQDATNSAKLEVAHYHVIASMYSPNN